MHIQFAELGVSDQDRAKAFYMAHFGCDVVADQVMSPHGWRWIELRFAGAITNLHFVRRQNDIPSAEPVMVLIEPDVAGVIERLRGEGVEIVSEPQPAPYDPARLVAEFRDSEGNRLVISSK